MAKSEGPSIRNFMQQMRRVGHSEHLLLFMCPVVQSDTPKIYSLLMAKNYQSSPFFLGFYCIFCTFLLLFFFYMLVRLHK